MSVLSDLLPADAGLRLDDLAVTPSLVIIRLVSTSDSATCPCCGTPSDCIRSSYWRTVTDLPWGDRPVALRLLVRRFRCVDPSCPRGVFCERLPGLLDARARSAVRMTDAHRAIGFALGGEAGARLAERLDMPTSPDTLLRRVKAADDEPAPPPRYVGIDDWAIRKGQRYSTIVIDLERGRVIDLLPGRDGEALKKWLHQHPGVEVISRDRWAAYAQAASEAAPQARQVADRWHLLKNLREAVERLLARLEPAVHEALRNPKPQMDPPVDEQPALVAVTEGISIPTPERIASAVRKVDPTTETTLSTNTTTTEQSAPQPSPSPRERARQDRRRRRAEQYERVRALRDQGQSLRQIARTMGLSVKCVTHYLRRQRCPDWNPGRRGPTRLDPFAVFIDSWIERGGTNAAALHAELAGLGCTVGYDAVRRCLARRLGSASRPGPRGNSCKPSTSSPPPSARKLSFEFIRRPEDRVPEEQARLDCLRGGEDALRLGLDLAAAFAAMLRRAGTMTLVDWLAAAEGSGCAEMRAFALGLRQDEAAVAAAVTEPWSNGPVEGQVNRLKSIKRQMYGRAGLRLLRARVRRAG